MPRPTVWDEETVLEAINGTGRFSLPDGEPNPLQAGTYTALAKRLKVSQETVRRYTERWPSLSAALRDVRDIGVDLAEEKLIDLINDGDFRAVRLMLTTRGASRGYRQHAVVHADLSIGNDPLSDLSDEELDAILS